MLRRYFLITIYLVSYGVKSIEENHLVPENSIYTNYYDQYSLEYATTVGRFFHKHLPYNQPKMIATPSFRSEYAVALNQDENGCEVIFLETKYSLEFYQLLDDEEFKKVFESDKELQNIISERPEDPLNTPVLKKISRLDNDVCARINNVWNNTLQETRYLPISDEPTIGLDGTTYHFSTWVYGHGTLSGKTWSPEPTTIPGKLVYLSKTIGQFAKKPNDKNKEEIIIAIEVLENEYK